MHAALDKNVLYGLRRAIPDARNRAGPTVQDWGTQHWMTYKATVRRQGVWHRNYNEELWAPMDIQAVAGWDRTMQRLLPNIVQALVKQLSAILQSFHQVAVAYAKEHCVNLAGVTMLDQQLQSHQRAFAELPTKISAIIQEHQRDANRSPTPIIAQDMQPAYTTCVNEAGPGTYMRMKGHMATHVDSAKDTMFQHATDNLRGLLSAMVAQIRNELVNMILLVVHKEISRDYQAVLVGGDTQNFSTLSRDERMLRGEVLIFLGEAENTFNMPRLILEDLFHSASVKCLLSQADKMLPGAWEVIRQTYVRDPASRNDLRRLGTMLPDGIENHKMLVSLKAAAMTDAATAAAGSPTPSSPGFPAATHPTIKTESD